MERGFSRWFFDQIHSRNLVYNQCWEDPALDHEVLEIGPSDRIVTITSAGCNALDYLLRGPAQIHCVDVNPYQNALLELKIAAIETLCYEQFFEMFGKGRIAHYSEIYRMRLRPLLSSRSRSIWDKRIHYFKPGGNGLYFSGTAGQFARVIRRYLNLRGLREDLEAFQAIDDLREQAEFYRDRIRPRLWSPVVRFLVARHSVLSMLGVPIEQIKQVERGSRSELISFVQERVDRTLSTIPIAQNYFWRVYINGQYSPDCCPNYLKREHFETLRDRISRIRLHTATLSDFLSSTTARFSVFVLLDHMDWLSSAPQLLQQEWRAILHSALPGARIIYRSGSLNCDYIPRFALPHLQFQTQRTSALHARDRVGTYASFHFATVTS